MKIIITILTIVFFMGTYIAQAQDMRLDHLSRARQLKILGQKAADELLQAENQAKEKILKIKQDKKALMRAIADLKNKNKNLKNKNKEIERNIKKLLIVRTKLQDDLAQTRGVTQELSGFIRIDAKELKNLIIESPQSAIVKDRQTFLLPMINQEKFPSMDDVKKMTDTFFNEIKASGEVKITLTDIIDRHGKQEKAKVLSLGNFTSIYKMDKGGDFKGEIGFLLYSDHSRRFFALSKLPDSGMKAKIAEYFKGQRPDVPIDISKGGALRQLTHQLSLKDQIPKGGPIVWPILFILFLAFLILFERIWFFATRQIRVEPLMVKIRRLIEENKYKECRDLLLKNKKRLIPKVLLTALPFRNQTRQDMENALQEAILGEIPKIERFLSTLGMLAAIAPLLGLLGTVTGMINTFHVITYYGTKDPRMMAGGISEALVTTMLGLSVAIPIMLFHTFLSRRVEIQIGTMEEKAVAFVNMVFKAKKADQ